MKERKFISGIHNYCDRWCERCEFTSKCSVFERTGKDDMFNETDFDNEQFCKGISESLQQCMELLNAAAKERGIDLDTIDIDETKFNSEDDNIHNHPAAILADEYMESTFRFMKAWDKEINGALKNISSPEKAQNILDALEVVHFYSTLIPAKAQRAINSSFMEQDFAEDLDLQDSLGSAKITILSIDRSLISWMVLYQQFAFMGDDIISQFSLLERLKKMLLLLFPDAMSFIRPGLDELQKS